LTRFAGPSSDAFSKPFASAATAGDHSIFFTMRGVGTRRPKGSGAARPKTPPRPPPKTAAGGGEDVPDERTGGRKPSSSSEESDESSAPRLRRFAEPSDDGDGGA